MNSLAAQGTPHRVQDFTKKTPYIIGRHKEVQRLKRYLHTGDERQVVYYWAGGGLGKTRLLEEVQDLIDEENEARGGYHTTGIIDLYHTDTHSTSDVERIIVERLDPENQYFSAYRKARQRYEVLRERGTDPLTLEKRRKELGELFIAGYRNMAVDARKVVLCFDTIELLQYESSIVEERVGLDTSDTRLKPWLLEKLSLMPKALIVLAGRPQQPPPGEEERDPQARLLEDLRAAFGGDLEIVEIQPFTLEETRNFLTTLFKEAHIASGELVEDADDTQVLKAFIPSDHLPVVHRLTGGRPIFLHLVFDLIWNLSLAPQEVLDLFTEHRELVEVPEEDPKLVEAREAMEGRILSAIFNETGALGEYLKRIALLPKGVDVEILEASLGLPQDEAQALLKSLEPLSFVKHFKELPGAPRIHPRRTFLHDEFYRLLTTGIIPGRWIAERQVAAAVIKGFYAPQIRQLRAQLPEAPVTERVTLRERLQKLQVEQLYYQLVCDVREGYTAYKRLSDEANRHRWVDFGMRLLDEFLRFYNDPERRSLFKNAGISYERVVRESAEMWCERFSWWKQRKRGIRLSEAIMASPGDFYLDPQIHTAIWGNIHALWGLARGVLHGYEPQVVECLEEALEMLPPLQKSNTEELLARARLTNARGFQFDCGGQIAISVHWYERSKAAYTKAGPEHDLEGFTSLLNNLSYGYAKQGRMTLARTVAHEALRINEETGNRYTTGLTLSTLSTISLMRGSYAKAREYGEEALEIFEALEDTHGTLLAYLDIAQAHRRWAKHEMEKGRAKKIPEVEQRLQAAQETLEKALELAERAGMQGHLVSLQAESGRLYRELGRLQQREESLETALPHYHTGARYLRQALASEQLGGATRADYLEDLGEIEFLSGDYEGAQVRIVEAEAYIPDAYRLGVGAESGEATEHEYYLALAKLEMLRGQMAFEDEDALEKGLQHYLMAYGYFTRFSPMATELDKLIEYVYRRLRELSMEQQRWLLDAAAGWLQACESKDEAHSFLETLHDLLGI